eukprot:43875-Prorocentrum_minimum.AAC.2
MLRGSITADELQMSSEARWLRLPFQALRRQPLQAMAASGRCAQACVAVAAELLFALSCLARGPLADRGGSVERSAPQPRLEEDPTGLAVPPPDPMAAAAPLRRRREVPLAHQLRAVRVLTRMIAPRGVRRRGPGGSPR